MKRIKYLYLFFLWVLFQNCLETKKQETEFYSVHDYKNVEKIDAHVHILTANQSFINQSREDNFRLLTISTDAPSIRPFEEQMEIAVQHLENFRDSSVAYTATFSVKNWNDSTWENHTMSYLKDCFSKGAIAVKIWKNVGMDLRDQNGKLVMIDHPRFDTILNFLTANHIPLVGHFGEPKNCWEPLDSMTVNDYKHYYRANPQYHMYLHPGITTYEDQINARDRMLEKHRDLRFIGAHLASLEWSLDELAKRLDEFPNMAVDMAERISHFKLDAMTDWEKTRDFCIKYQDRLIYGTDIIVDDKTDPAEMKKYAHEMRMDHWKFFVTASMQRSPSVDGEYRGLKLPRKIIDKIYFKNAQKWYPGL
ncbi:MAG: amidohydrolase family protein [Mangrovibacterium sp.]